MRPLGVNPLTPDHVTVINSCKKVCTFAPLAFGVRRVVKILTLQVRAAAPEPGRFTANAQVALTLWARPRADRIMSPVQVSQAL